MLEWISPCSFNSPIFTFQFRSPLQQNVILKCRLMLPWVFPRGDGHKVCSGRAAGCAQGTELLQLFQAFTVLNGSQQHLEMQSSTTPPAAVELSLQHQRHRGCFAIFPALLCFFPTFKPGYLHLLCLNAKFLSGISQLTKMLSTAVPWCQPVLAMILNGKERAFTVLG